MYSSEKSEESISRRDVPVPVPVPVLSLETSESTSITLRLPQSISNDQVLKFEGEVSANPNQLTQGTVYAFLTQMDHDGAEVICSMGFGYSKPSSEGRCKYKIELKGDVSPGTYDVRIAVDDAKARSATGKIVVTEPLAKK